METLLQQAVNGLVVGSVYALIALGYTLVYGIIELINFAHGEIFMVGAFGALATWGVGHFAGWQVSLSAGSVLLAVGFSAAVGVFFGYYPARRAAALLPIQALRYE